MGLCRTPYIPLTTKQGGRKVPLSNFRQTVKGGRLDVDESVNGTHFRIQRSVVKWCNELSYIFRQSPKWVKADRAQYVWTSSVPITIVVMTLLKQCNWHLPYCKWDQQGHHHNGDQVARRPSHDVLNLWPPICDPSVWGAWGYGMGALSR